MFLLIDDWDIDRCVLWGIPAGNCLTGEVAALPPLDQVVGDLLSLTFNWSGEQGDEIHLVKDGAWYSAVKDTPLYARIELGSSDLEAEDRYDWTNLQILNHFFEMTVGKNEKNQTFRNFELMLAFCQAEEPHPEKHFSVRGSLHGAESPDDVSAYNDVIRAFNKGEGSHFFSLLEDSDVNLRCKYAVHGFADLAFVSAYLMLKSGKRLARCAYCGRLFSPKRAGEMYCSRTAIGKHTTCKESAKYEKQLQRERSSESGKIYKSVSTMLAAKVNFAKNESDAQAREDELKQFRYKAKEWREAVKHGEKSEKEYIDFLNSYKKHKPKQ